MKQKTENKERKAYSSLPVPLRNIAYFVRAYREDLANHSGRDVIRFAEDGGRMFDIRLGRAYLVMSKMRHDEKLTRDLYLCAIGKKNCGRRGPPAVGYPRPEPETRYERPEFESEVEYSGTFPFGN